MNCSHCRGAPLGKVIFCRATQQCYALEHMKSIVLFGSAGVVATLPGIKTKGRTEETCSPRVRRGSKRGGINCRNTGRVVVVGRGGCEEEHPATTASIQRSDAAAATGRKKNRRMLLCGIDKNNRRSSLTAWNDCDYIIETMIERSCSCS